jgi:hypothetical protein
VSCTLTFDAQFSEEGQLSGTILVASSERWCLDRDLAQYVTIPAFSPTESESNPAALQLRLYALYDLNKRLLAVTVPLSALTVLFASAVQVWAFVQSTPTAGALTGTPYCIAEGLPAAYWVLWAPVLAFEALLLALVVRRALIDDYAESGSAGRRIVSNVARTRRVFYVLVRDSVLYFVVCVPRPSAPTLRAHAPRRMFAAYTTNLVMWLTASNILFEVPIAFSTALSAVLCSRLLLNMHGEVEVSRRRGVPGMAEGNLVVWGVDGEPTHLRLHQRVSLPGEV